MRRNFLFGRWVFGSNEMIEGSHLVRNVCRLDRSFQELSNSSLSGNLGRCIESGSVVEPRITFAGFAQNEKSVQPLLLLSPS